MLMFLCECFFSTFILVINLLGGVDDQQDVVQPDGFKSSLAFLVFEGLFLFVAAIVVLVVENVLCHRILRVLERLCTCSCAPQHVDHLLLLCFLMS